MKICIFSDHQSCLLKFFIFSCKMITHRIYVICLLLGILVTSQKIQIKTIEITDPQLVDDKLVSQTISRRYSIVEPKNLDQPLNLIIYFGGWTTTEWVSSSLSSTFSVFERIRVSVRGEIRIPPKILAAMEVCANRSI